MDFVAAVDRLLLTGNCPEIQRLTVTLHVRFWRMPTFGRRLRIASRRRALLPLQNGDSPQLGWTVGC